MNLVSLEKISKQYGERILLDGVDLQINAGDRIGLIGLNGSGKTTLLRVVTGLEPPDAGQVTVWGGVRIEYVPQEPPLDDSLTVLDTLFQSDSPQMRLLRDYRLASDRLARQPDDPARQAALIALSDQMDRAAGWTAEANAKIILTRLGVTDFDAPVGTLSGGQRKRVALARALIDPADLLVLDEPTNHIDADTIAWLEEYLLTVPSALLMVTHDRYFLDRVVNRIVELDRRQLVNYPGNYGRYLELRTARHEQLAAGEAKRQALLRRELAWLRRGAMARSTKQKARQQRIAELQQLNDDRGEQQVAMALASRRLGKRVLEVTNLAKRYGDLTLFERLAFQLNPGDRIGIIGPNGAGKSTFLDILAGHVAPDTGEVAWGETVVLGYYDQAAAGFQGKERLRVIEFINEVAPLIRTDDGRRVEAAQMLDWFLFTRPEQQTRLVSLSGGERRRLYLLRTLVHQPNVLLLDEPTNDLDIQTLAVLETFLDQFRGCLLVVSHDRYFLDRNVDYLFSFEDGRLGTRYPAPYSNYRRQRAAELAAAERGDDGRSLPPPPPRRPPPSAAPRKLSWREKRELEALEQQIAGLEEVRDAAAAAINQAGHDYQQLQALTEELEGVEAALETAVARWFELAELVE